MGIEVSLDAILRAHQFYYCDRPFRLLVGGAQDVLRQIHSKVIAVGIEDTLCARIPPRCLSALPSTPSTEPYWVLRPFANGFLKALIAGGNHVTLWTRLPREMFKAVVGHEQFHRELVGSELIDRQKLHDRINLCGNYFAAHRIDKKDLRDIADGIVRTPSFARADYLVDTQPEEAKNLAVYQKLGGAAEGARTILVPPCEVQTPSNVWDLCKDEGLLNAAYLLAERIAEHGSNPRKLSR